jgi:FkbM family methyltransferase
MFAGCYQPEIIGAMERYLCPGDVFLDVGANVGFLTAWAAGLVAREGEVHSFEPVPKYFAKLQTVVAANPEYKLFVNQAACGDTEGTIEIAVDADNMGGSSAVPNRVQHVETRVQVPLLQLD